MNEVIANLTIEGPDRQDHRTYTLKIVVSGKHLAIDQVQADSIEEAGAEFTQRLGRSMRLQA